MRPSSHARTWIQRRRYSRALKELLFRRAQEKRRLLNGSSVKAADIAQADLAMSAGQADWESIRGELNIFQQRLAIRIDTLMSAAKVGIVPTHLLSRTAEELNGLSGGGLFADAVRPPFLVRSDTPLTS